jgi:hypothetical protein
MMPIDAHFLFSANSLQDYLDCPRRFELKYILRQSWPAEESEPVLEFEHHIQLGSQFHQMVHQYLNGISQEILLQSIPDPDLENWFQNFLAYYTSLKFERIFSEFPLRLSINQSPVVAVFDLLGMTPDSDLWILDWKTSGKFPQKDNLASRIQTILYPYVALETAPTFMPGLVIPPEKIHMAYLYVHQDHQNLLTFDYSTEIHTKNRKFLENLISEILPKDSGSFECTSDERRCKFCVYRSLCERGVAAGNLKELDTDDDLQSMLANLDFEAQDEIAF